MQDPGGPSVVAVPLRAGASQQEFRARVSQALAGVAVEKTEELREAVRIFLGAEAAQLAQQIRAGGSGLEVPHQRASLYSALLQELWIRAGGDKAGDQLVLGAVGGFGRGEMSPASDLDLMFIREGSQAGVAEEVVKKVLYVLWDLGFKVGHACRTIGETMDRSESEPMIKTALLDARYLAGSSLLWDKFQAEFRRRGLENEVEKYLSWRLENQQSRHAKEGGTVFVQEPNLKSGVGGLRDFHNLRWVGKVCGEGDTLEKLVERGWLGEVEARQVEQAFAFLMMVREWLHEGQGGPGDVLTLRRQGELAEAMGYPQPNILRKSEALMREVYGQMRTLHLLCNSTATRLCQQRLGKPKGFWSFFAGWRGARRATDGFLLNGAELQAEHAGVFAEDPARMIRVFRILQDQGSVPGAELKALIRANFALLTDSLVQQKEVQETFLHILKQKGKVGRILRAMHESEVLGRMIPEFAPLTCLVQHEFFHRYTADEHTLVCLEQLDAMLGSKEPDLRKYAELYARVEVPEILALAVLLHDTGKAELTRNHEELGAANAAHVARRFGFWGRELRLMTFLVDHHMTLSAFARKNLDEPETIRELARLVQDPEKLNLLMLISAADVRAVAGKNNWSGWRELLVWNLYRKTREMLAGEEEFLKAEEEKQEKRREEVREVLSREFTPDEAREHLERMGPAYLRMCPADLVLRHLQGVHEFMERRVSGPDALVPLVKWLDQPEEGHTEVLVVTWNRERLFSKIAGSFALAGLNILSANIFTRRDDVVVDTFRVCNERMEAVSHPVDRQTFEKSLTEALEGTEDHLTERIAQVGPALWQKSLGEAEFPSSLRLDRSSEPGRTLIHVDAPDRVGLLFALTRAIADEGMQISGARITTEKGAAWDTFVLVENSGEAVCDEDRLSRVFQRLKGVISQ